MPRNPISGLATLGLSTVVMASAALAQRPPAPGQGPPQMSVERAWGWLMARPGVMIAIAIILAAIIYMIVTRSKKRT